MSDWHCDLCGSERAQPFSAHTVRCSDCSLVATHPTPAAAELQRRYGSGYYAGWDGGGARAVLWRRRLDIVRRILPSGRILDAGCGAGEFVRAARAAGYEAEGTEFSAAARAAVRDFPVYPGLPEAPGPYRAVTLWHVLEHTPSPTDMLLQARRALQPGGFLFVAVPNLDSYWFNAVYRLAKGRRLELYTPETKEPHLVHFSRRTLRRLLEKTGFSPRLESCDVPDADWRYRLSDWPARALCRLTGVNWTTTLLSVCVKTDGP